MTRVRKPLTILLLLGLWLPKTVQAQITQALRARVSQGVAVGLLVKRVNPEYPKDVKKKRIQGLVTLRILISREGDVSQVTLLSGHPALAPLAINAVKQWKYKPYLLQGEPIEVETTVQINFTLAGS